MASKIKISKKGVKVTGGQTEVKGHPEAGRLMVYRNVTPDPDRHFVLKLLPKYQFLTTN
jgi:hypothetical protein